MINRIAEQRYKVERTYEVVIVLYELYLYFRYDNISSIIECHHTLLYPSLWLSSWILSQNCSHWNVESENFWKCELPIWAVTWTAYKNVTPYVKAPWWRWALKEAWKLGLQYVLQKGRTAREGRCTAARRATVERPFLRSWTPRQRRAANSATRPKLHVTGRVCVVERMRRRAVVTCIRCPRYRQKEINNTFTWTIYLHNIRQVSMYTIT